MRAQLLRRPGPVETDPLVAADLGVPEPGPGEVLIRVRVCGICRTDLHVVEGDLPRRRSPLVPGHQIVGTVERRGPEAHLYAVEQRVGVAWLHRTCGACGYCASGRENLCDRPEFTGYSVNGGFAEFIAAPEEFVYPMPEGFADLQAAPLLCAGIIGFRCLRAAGVTAGVRLGFHGFGAAAHVAIQVARHWGASVFVCTRDPRHRDLALSLGAEWAGGALDPPPKRASMRRSHSRPPARSCPPRWHRCTKEASSC